VSWPEARTRFPVLERVAYLNAGTFGPLSRETLTAVSRVRQWEATHGRAGRRYTTDMLARRERVRGLLAEEIGVPAGNVALTDSTTRSVQIVVVGLGLGPEDEVVTTDCEHFGLLGPLAASGARLQIVPVRDLRAAEVFAAIEAAVTPRTRLIAVSAVSWLDGRLMPWRELRESTAVPVLVDGAQSVGAIEVDAVGADFYTISAQKWLCGPDGTGGLYVLVPEELPPRLVAYPSTTSYDPRTGEWEPKPGAARFDPGHLPASSLAGLEAALLNLPTRRYERARSLTERCRELLLAEGYDVVTEPGQGTLVSWRWGDDAADAAATLYERGVVVRDLPGTGLLRASVGWWNDGSDLERLVEALAEARAAK
jgi:L-cysteine/cystine lyase